MCTGKDERDSAGFFDCLYVCLGYELSTFHVSAGYDSDYGFHDNLHILAYISVHFFRKDIYLL